MLQRRRECAGYGKITEKELGRQPWQVKVVGQISVLRVDCPSNVHSRPPWDRADEQQAHSSAQQPANTVRRKHDSLRVLRFLLHSHER